MNWPSYPNYKDSDIPWMGCIPDRWTTAPCWTLFRRTKNLGHPELELLSVYRDYGVLPKASRNDNFNKPSEDLSQYQRVDPGYLVVNKMKAWQGSISVSEHTGIVSPAYFVYEALSRDNDLRFLHYSFRSTLMVAQYASHSYGVRPNQWDLDPQAFSRLPILLPPPSEQTQIAKFLDRETAKIDALIDKQEQLIDTLREDRAATITHAVTKGLDQSPKLNATGIDFIGAIPSHWSVRTLKHLVAQFQQGVSPQASAELAEDGWGVLKSGCVNGGVFRDFEHKKLPDGFEFSLGLAVQMGDLLVCRASGSTNLVGSAAIVQRLRYKLILSDKTFRLIPNGMADSNYLGWALNSRPYREQVLGAISGAEGLANNLPLSSLKNFKLPVPPIAEQRAIVSFLDERCAKIDSLIVKSTEMIQVLREYRSALITNAVTGKIDVREAV